VQVGRNVYMAKQGPKVWNETIDTYLRSLGFTGFPRQIHAYIEWDGDDVVITEFMLMIPYYWKNTDSLSTIGLRKKIG
jgi:hypothetical protein